MFELNNNKMLDPSCIHWSTCMVYTSFSHKHILMKQCDYQAFFLHLTIPSLFYDEVASGVVGVTTKVSHNHFCYSSRVLNNLIAPFR